MSQPDMFDEVMKKAREITGVPESDAHWADLLADNPAQTPTQMVSEAIQKNQIEIPDQPERPVYENLPAIETSGYVIAPAPEATK